MSDPVNHPKHYTSLPSGIECIQVTEHMNFCVGNAVKYCWRAGLKGDAIEDLKKARWYIDREIARLEGQSSKFELEQRVRQKGTERLGVVVEQLESTHLVEFDDGYEDYYAEDELEPAPEASKFELKQRVRSKSTGQTGTISGRALGQFYEFRVEFDDGDIDWCSLDSLEPAP